jgi:polysaccharide export outer membrane protein
LQKPSIKIPSYPQVREYEDYRLHVGDELNIYVFSLESEANQVFNQGSTNSGGMMSSSGSKSIYTYTIYADGCINYPVIGKVQMVGKTLREASVYMKEQLKEDFIVNDFTVKISLVNNTYSIISEKSSGKYTISTERMNIFQAIATSQDLADYADRAHVKIIRQTDKGTIIKEFDIRSKDILQSEFYYVQPNDVIYVQSFNGQFFRLGSFFTVLSTITSTITFVLFIDRLTGGHIMKEISK